MVIYNNPIENISWAQITFLGARMRVQVNFDFEHFKPYSAYTPLVLQTAATLRAASANRVGGEWQTTICTSRYPRNVPLDYAALANATDGLLPMAYSDHKEGSAYAGPVSQLHSTNKPNPGYGSSYPGLPGTLLQFKKLKVPMSALIMGQPWFGWEWPVSSTTVGAATAVRAGACEKDRHAPGCDGTAFSALQPKLAAAGKSGLEVHWDPVMEQPYYNRQEKTGGETVHRSGSNSSVVQLFQGWYDDERSLAAKNKYIKDNGLQGVGVWGLWYGPTPNGSAMWASLHAAYGGGSV